tara:strand:- start:7942 stop:8193 length:252 start_codon:yes stop_codon:yes gene_type:complete
MKVAISGFGKDKNLYNLLKKNGYIISEVITEDTKCVITKENLDYMEFKSAKIKQALMKNVPILSLEDTNREDISIIKQIKLLS